MDPSYAPEVCKMQGFYLGFYHGYQSINQSITGICHLAPTINEGGFQDLRKQTKFSLSGN
jgi:hypothetical protein